MHRPSLLPTSNLDGYLETAASNAEKVRARGGVWLRLMREIDQTFILAAETLVPQPGTVVGAFLIACHGSWLAAVNLGLQMHVAAVMQNLRGAIESACYGYLVQHDPTAWDRWKSRPSIEAARRDPAAMSLRKKVGAEFSVSKIATLIEAPWQPRIIDVHEHLIDDGAHFNRSALDRAYRKIGRPDDFYSSELRIIMGKEEDQAFCFRRIVEVGSLSLRVLTGHPCSTWDSARIESALARIDRAMNKRPEARLARRN